MKIKSNLKIALVSLGLVFATSASAVKVTSGEFALDFDEAGLLALSAKIENKAWFDSVASLDKTTQQLIAETPAEAVPDVFVFKVFGESISTPPVGLSGRFPQISTFEYDDDPIKGSGRIGLAGLHRISTIGGNLLFGDYDLQYDKSRIDNGAKGSGWFLTNRNTFALIAFDLTNVKVDVVDDSNFTMTGDVVLGKSLAGMLKIEDGEGIDVGDFTFTTKGEADSDVDGSIAGYSIKTKILTLPVIKTDDTRYSAVFRVVVLADGRSALELKAVEPTTTTSHSPATFDVMTGVITMPEIVVSGGEETSKVKAIMTLDKGSFPSRFILMSVENVVEQQHQH